MAMVPCLVQNGELHRRACIVREASVLNPTMPISPLSSVFPARVLKAVSGLVVAAVLSSAGPVLAQPSDELFLRARDAYRQRNQASLLMLRDNLITQRHPLAGWADHWLMLMRLGEASPEEVDQYLARWGDDYVADRLRNDWLLELGARRDWTTFLRVQPTFRMNDDRAVSCYGVLARQATTRSADAALAQQARQFWWTLKQPDEGCQAMAKALLAAQVLSERDVWRKIWLANDAWQPKTAAQAVRLLGEDTQQAVARVMAQPQAYLMSDSATKQASGTYVTRSVPGPDRWVNGKRKPGKARQVREWVAPPALPAPEQASALYVLAFQRWAAQDAAAAAQALQAADAGTRWRMSRDDQAWVWASIGRVAASNLQPLASTYFERAWALGGARAASTWGPETQAWWARSALRTAASGQRSGWTQVDAAINAMPPEMQQDVTWVYWHARSHLAQAAGGAAGETRRREGLQMLSKLAAQPVGFYGLLARDDLGEGAPRLPARPAPISVAERSQARATPGLGRALHLYALGLRSEGAREWNYTLSFGKPGGMSDRELIAAADWACEQEIWDRCINTSERTRQEIDLAQRFPTPFKQDIITAAQSVGLDPAYMFGLIRQESRFHVSAQSHVGASGLMQVMPATAAWTARKLGMNDYRRDLLNDRDVNLKLGAGYLKLMVDEFAGSQAMAAAGYNAGPNRPRRWRDGPMLDAAVWAENIPFTETRDYVKKVLSNAATYAHLLHGKALTLRQRLGSVGPRPPEQGQGNDDLP
jgi:soluble lytic murein transglycosylase